MIELQGKIHHYVDGSPCYGKLHYDRTETGKKGRIYVYSCIKCDKEFRQPENDDEYGGNPLGYGRSEVNPIEELLNIPPFELDPLGSIFYGPDAIGIDDFLDEML